MRTTGFMVLALAASLGGVGCKHLPGGGHMPGGAADKVDPNACGDISTNDVGRKLKAFLEASVTLEAKSGEMVVEVKAGCDAMGKELGFSDADLKGDPKAVCDKVLAKMQDDMKAGVKAKGAIKVVATPAVCKVDVDASVSAAASCEGSASANVKASCTGHCGGKCDGTCEGGTNTGGSCTGTCKGKCEADCEGAADVDASAQCKASGEVHANADVSCTPPSVDVTLDASMTVDKPKAEQVVAALKNGLPKILEVKAKLVPMQFALKGYLTAAADLSKEGSSLARQFEKQTACVLGQIGAVANAQSHIKANVDVSVSVSASASASAGGG